MRGYRIELGEIEVALARHAQVAEAVVVAQPGPGGEQRLVGYFVARPSNTPTPAVLREYLRTTLPDYMAIPAPQWIRRAVRRRRLVPRRSSLRDRRRLPDQALLDPFVT